MDPLSITAIVSGATTVLGSLFGGGNKQPSAPDQVWYDIDIIEQQKDNSALYGIIGIGFLIALLITAYFLLRKK